MVAGTLARWDENAFEDACLRAETGEILAPGVYLAAGQLARLLELLPPDEEHPDRRRARVVDLRGATVDGDCGFAQVTFAGPVIMTETSFVGHARFVSVLFGQEADFERALFEQGVTFRTTRFDAGASFVDARMNGPGTFTDVRMPHSAEFGGVRFAEQALFADARLEEANFASSTFGGRVLFLDTALTNASFVSATYEGRAVFRTVRFEGIAEFDDGTFRGPASFLDCAFRDRAFFEQEVDFADACSFERSSFDGRAGFAGAQFHAGASFKAVRFGGEAVFADASFADDATFDDADFAAAVDLGRVTFASAASFARTRFERARMLGPLIVEDTLSLADATFDAPVRIVTLAAAIDCGAAIFRAGLDLFASRADITAHDADFAAPSLIAGNEGMPDPTRLETRVLSLRGAKVALLTIATADMSVCHFAGAHGLDRLQLEQVRLQRTPEGWRRRQPFRWTARHTIAEERAWRVSRGRSSDWREPGPLPLPGDEPPAAARVAGIYRALRKGREDQKDEPGAADFYYGEMEMRRMDGSRADRRARWIHARPIRHAERAVLWAYWLVSGYGLRASRAFAALGFVVLLLAVPLDLWGFRPDRTYGQSLLFALESTVNVLRPPAAATLTAGGQVVQIALRILGPLLFGLAALALRSRVKR